MEPVNKIKNVTEFRASSQGSEPMRVIIQKAVSGEVLYDNVTKGGAIVAIESIRVEDFGSVMGTQQVYLWGNPVCWFYAYDQLKQHVLSPESRDRIEKALMAARLPGAKEMFGMVQDDMKSQEERAPEIGYAFVSVLPHMRAGEYLVDGKDLFAGRDYFMAYGHGFKADLFDDGEWYVCPGIHNEKPGSGKLDRFIDELMKKIPRPLRFTNFTNARLKAHLIKRGIRCD